MNHIEEKMDPILSPLEILTQGSRCRAYLPPWYLDEQAIDAFFHTAQHLQQDVRGKRARTFRG